mgnify:CR=1 FL=1
MEQKSFGKLADGEGATLYTISNTKGSVHRLQISERRSYRLW